MHNIYPCSVVFGFKLGFVDLDPCITFLAKIYYLLKCQSKIHCGFLILKKINYKFEKNVDISSSIKLSLSHIFLNGSIQA